MRTETISPLKFAKLPFWSTMRIDSVLISSLIERRDRLFYYASDLDILKSFDKLWDCTYLTQFYIDPTPEVIIN